MISKRGATASVLAAVLAFALSAEAGRKVWFEDDCEGAPRIGFADISEPTVRGREAALATGRIVIDREGYTDISEMRSHAGVHAFVVDTTLDGLSGKWGGRASWGSTEPLAIGAEGPVFLTAFVRTEVLSPEISVEMAVLFDGADGRGNAVRGGCLQFKARGQDPNGWLVFSCDVVALVRKHGFRPDRITGWRLVLNGPAGRPLKKARALLYVDDISFASAPPKMPALAKLGEEAKYQKIEPGPHTVGYMSLYDRFPKASRNRTWNSSFENGFDRWSGGISPLDGDLHVADSAKAVRIVRGDSPHGDCHVELGERQRVTRGIDRTPYGGKADLSAVLRGASDGERLYLDIEVTDDVRATPYDAVHEKRLIWSNDALQMGFDRADGTGLKELNFSAPPAGEVFFTLANDPIREDLIRFKAHAEGTVTDYRIVIPWKALWSDFTAGDEARVKFCLAVVDNDGDRGNPRLRTYGDRQALQLAPGLYLGGKQSAAYPKFALEKMMDRESVWNAEGAK